MTLPVKVCLACCWKSTPNEVECEEGIIGKGMGMGQCGTNMLLLHIQYAGVGLLFIVRLRRLHCCAGEKALLWYIC